MVAPLTLDEWPLAPIRTARLFLRAPEARDREAFLEVGNKAQRGGRRRVPAVEQGMDANLADALTLRQVDQRDEVPVVGMHAARPDQADDVQPAVIASCASCCLEQGRSLVEASRRA